MIASASSSTRNAAHAQRGGHAFAKKGQHAHGERDVRGHRHTPASNSAGFTPVQRQVDQGRHHHAADRRSDRQRGALEITQLARMEFAPYLEAHHEEEDDHQPVVDPEVNILRETQTTDAQRDGRVP
jgi:hypothetical protein